MTNRKRCPECGEPIVKCEDGMYRCTDEECGFVGER